MSSTLGRWPIALAASAAISATSLAACTTDDDPHAPSSISGNQTTIDLVVAEPPIATAPRLIAYRDGSGPWQTPERETTGTYRLVVTNDYEYLVVCADGSSFDAELSGATVGDGSSQYAGCFASNAPATWPTTIAVTGDMVQPGTAEMDDQTSAGTTANWPVALTVTPGANDLVAFDATSALIQRDVMIESDAASVGRLDLATDGSPLGSTAITVTNTDANYQGVQLEWLTGHGAASWPGSGSQLALPPAALVAADDLEEITAYDGVVDGDGEGTSEREVDETFIGTPTTLSLALPDAMTGVAFATTGSTIAASWSSVPAFDQLSLFASTLAPVTQDVAVTVTPSWVAATGAGSELAFDIAPNPPGYDSAWHVPPAGPSSSALNVYGADATGTVSYTVTHDQVLGDSPTAVRSNPRSRTSRSRFRRRS